MKVSLPKTDGTKTVPILSLVKEPDKYVSKEKLRSFELLSDPSTATSPKYKSTILVLDGTENLRTAIKWTLDINRIFVGLSVSGGKAKVRISQEL